MFSYCLEIYIIAIISICLFFLEHNSSRAEHISGRIVVFEIILPWKRNVSILFEFVVLAVMFYKQHVEIGSHPNVSHEPTTMKMKLKMEGKVRGWKWKWRACFWQYPYTEIMSRNRRNFPPEYCFHFNFGKINIECWLISWICNSNEKLKHFHLNCVRFNCVFHSWEQ